MNNPIPGRRAPAALVMTVVGSALLIVGVAGWLTGNLRPLQAAGFALIGLGFAWRALRRPP